MISFRALISSLLIICSSNAWAQCDFREANYAKELARPDSITKINIDVVDSRKFSINFARILISNLSISDQNLKNLMHELRCTIALVHAKCMARLDRLAILGHSINA